MKSLRDISFPLKGDGYLDIATADPALRDAATLWISDFVDLYENGEKLPKPSVRAVKAELPSSRAFASYEQAIANVLGPALPSDTKMYLGIRGCSTSSSSTPSPRTRIEGSRFGRASRGSGFAGERSCYAVSPGKPERAVRRSRRRRHGAARSALASGGLPVRQAKGSATSSTAPTTCCSSSAWSCRSGAFRPLVAVITAFTVAHSVTLIARRTTSRRTRCGSRRSSKRSIATSIFYMAIENIHRHRASSGGG